MLYLNAVRSLSPCGNLSTRRDSTGIDALYRSELQFPGYNAFLSADKYTLHKLICESGRVYTGLKALKGVRCSREH